MSYMYMSGLLLDLAGVALAEHEEATEVVVREMREQRLLVYPPAALELVLLHALFEGGSQRLLVYPPAAL